MANAFKAAYLSQVLQTQQPLAWDFQGAKLELTIDTFQKLVPEGANPNAGQVKSYVLYNSEASIFSLHI